MDPNPAIPSFISQQETEAGTATDTSENVQYDSGSSTSALILNPHYISQYNLVILITNIL